MPASVKWRYLGSLRLLSKAVTAMAEMEVSPQEEMANPQGGLGCKLETFLMLGREFESRCSHSNWDFPS